MQIRVLFLCQDTRSALQWLDSVMELTASELGCMFKSGHAVPC